MSFARPHVPVRTGANHTGWLAFAAFVTGVSLLLLGPLAPVSRADAVSFTFAPPTQTLNPGDQFTIDLVLTSSGPLRGVQLGMTFDPSLIQIDKISDGPFFVDWAKANSAQANTVIAYKPDNTKGVVSTGATTILGGDPNKGPSGSGVLLHIAGTTKSGATGQASLSLNRQVLLSDIKNLPIRDIVSAPALIGVGTSPAGAPTLAQLDVEGQPKDPVIPTPAPVNQGPAAAAPQPAVQPQAVARPTPVTAVAVAQATAPPAVAVQPAPVAAPASQASAAESVPQPTAVAFTPPVGQNAAVDVPTAVVAGAAAQSLQPQQPVQLAGVSNQATATNQQPAGASGIGAQGSAQTPAFAQPVAAVQSAVPTVLPPGANKAPGVSPTQAPLRPAVAASARPRPNSGLVIPWEVVAGVGGGLITAAIVLYAFGRRETTG